MKHNLYRGPTLITSDLINESTILVAILVSF